MKKIQSTPPPVIHQRWRAVAWLNIAFQIVFPLSLSFTPAMAKAAPAALPSTAAPLMAIATVPYVLGPGETTLSVATRYNLTLEELKTLNGLRNFAKSFSALGTGDEIDVPRSHTSLFNSAIPVQSSSQAEDKLARGAQTAGSLFSGGNTGGAAADLARSSVVGGAGQAGEQWLNQFGTARVQLNADRNFRFTDSAVDLLVPLRDTERSTVFSQLGVRNSDQRNTVNLGLGVRTEKDGWMYGANTFYDNDITGNNRRLGVGAEAWTDYLRLSANSYFGLTDWHPSRDFADYNERPANGFDLRAQAWLPSYPQLGGSLMFEQYRGDEVALFGKDSRQKDPYALTAGINYTPIPLFTVGAQHRTGKGGANDSSLNFQLNYRLGESWQSHLDSSKVGPSRTLAGSRYDLVDRNYNIVLDYQRRDLIRLALPAQITGAAGTSVTLTADITAEHGLDRIDWDSAPLLASGGRITQVSPQAITVVMPAYQGTPGADNTYRINAIAHDNRGNLSNRAVTTVNVTAPEIITLASLAVENNNAVADGQTAIRVRARVIDGNGNPVPGETVAFSADNGATVLSPTAVSDDDGFTETGITSRTVGPVMARASLDGSSQQAAVAFVAGGADQTQTQLEVLTTGNKAADGIDAHRVRLTVRDALNNPIGGQAVSFGADNDAQVTPLEGDVTGDDGTLMATVVSSRAGLQTVTATVGDFTTSGVEMTFIAGKASEANTLIQVLTQGDKIAGSQAHQVRVTARDAQDNPVAGAVVKWVAAGDDAHLSIPGGETGEDGTLTVDVTSNRAGVVIVSAALPGFIKASDGMRFVAGAAAETRTVVEVITRGDKIAGDSDGHRVKVTVRDANDNPVGGQAVTFATASPGATLSSPGGDTAADGTLEVGVTSNQAGTVVVSATVAGFTRDSDGMGFVAGAAAETRTAVEVVTTGDKVAGDSDGHRVKITVRDANDNPIRGQAVTFATTSPGAMLSSPGGDTAADGTLEVGVTNTLAGTVVVSATVAGFTKSSDGMQFVAGPASESRSTIEVLTTGDKVAGDSDGHRVKVQVRDANSNPIAGQAVSFATVTPGAALSNPGGTTAADGTIDVGVTSTRAGAVTVFATVAGFTLASDGMTFVAGAAAENTTLIEVITTGDKEAGLEAHQVKVRVRDAHDNPVAGQAVTFASASPGVTFSRQGGDTAADGTLAVDVTSDQAGLVVVNAAVAGFTKASAPLSFIVSPAILTLDVLRNRSLDNGAEYNEVQLLVENGMGAGMEGKSVVFSVNNGASLTSPANAVTGADGKAKVTFTNTRGGTATVTAQVDGVDVTQDTIFLSPRAINSVSPVANPHSFGPNSGFPNVGFDAGPYAGSSKPRFQINPMGNIGDNGSLTWSSSNAVNAPIDENGIVTLNARPSSEVTLMARGDQYYYTYKFTVRKWLTYYRPNSTNRYSWDDTQTLCASNGKSMLAAADLTSGVNQRAVGSMFGEWGARPGGWPGEAVTEANSEGFWTKDGSYNGRPVVSLFNGDQVVGRTDGARYREAACKM
ncbi:Ig-like domain-containing protein [Sodalis sp. RH20]|uniref:Ig-like domain-containing protein n=1 Tax=unclassified Sodalis (in: enterobacteria) TaxID=2636512 RepID=UPI0039B37105